MEQRLIDLVTRIADALERLAPPPAAPLDLAQADAFVWHPSPAAPRARSARSPASISAC